MLSVDNLSCRRAGRVTFRDVVLTAAPGDFILVIGANGVGKSTLLRSLAGLLEPATGTISWLGSPITNDPAAHRARLHYIGHLDALKPALTVGEMLDYWHVLRGEQAVRDAGILPAFGIAELIDRPIRRLSAGQKRRLSLTRLLLSDAPLWLLDEPTTALDKNGQDLLRVQIARHRNAGGIVIAASHEDLHIADVKPLFMRGTA